MAAARDEGPRRAHLDLRQPGARLCGDAGGRQGRRWCAKAPATSGIVTAYNDMLSAHQPFETYPELIRRAAREVGGTAQVAGGVPAMCDGVTQGQAGHGARRSSRAT